MYSWRRKANKLQLERATGQWWAYRRRHSDAANPKEDQLQNVQKQRTTHTFNRVSTKSKQFLAHLTSRYTTVSRRPSPTSPYHHLQSPPNRLPKKLSPPPPQSQKSEPSGLKK